jgi:hypothetical protein
MIIDDKKIKMIGRAKIDGMAVAKMKQNLGCSVGQLNIQCTFSFSPNNVATILRGQLKKIVCYVLPIGPYLNLLSMKSGKQ